MNKYFKKFSIMFVMSLILMLGCCVSAFADDNGLIGVANRKGTDKNSANIGDDLSAPELGWKRFDELDNRIIYTGNWKSDSTTTPRFGTYYKGTRSIGNQNAKLTFKFSGSKLRLIGDRWVNPNAVRTSNCKIKIDGIERELKYTSATNGNDSYLVGGTLVFEELNLGYGIHSIEVVNYDTADRPYAIDAIDIDDNGTLINTRSISLDNTTLTLPVENTQKLTATTTPAGAQVEWTSDNKDIATVDENGNVTGHVVGTAIITAKIKETDIKATCVVTVTNGGTTEPTNPNPPAGDGNLFIELVDGQIKSYQATASQIEDFKQWYLDRDNTKSNKPYYHFAKGSYNDYVIHDKIDWFEVR